MGPDVKTVKANGVTVKKETRWDSLLTYKRRKSAKVAEIRKPYQDLVVQPNEKSKSYTHEEAQFLKNVSHPPTVSPSNCSLVHERNVILEQLSQSLDAEDALRKCIQRALAFHPGSGSRTRVEDSIHYNEDYSNFNSKHVALHGFQKAVGVNMESDLKHRTFTELCEQSFSDIIMSERFAQLCSLLVENFQGLKTDKVLNLSRINSRMKDSAYDSSPLLFQFDIQEIWAKLQKVGADIAALAKCLSDKTRSSFHEQFPSQEHILTIKTEPTDEHAVNGAHICRGCQKEADGPNTLVCDSCEGMYHVCCIEPAVEIPTTGWYCTHCACQENEPSLDHCIACKKQSTAESSQPNDATNEVHIPRHMATDELKKCSNGYFPVRGSQRYTECKLCANEIRNEDDYKICGHSLCPNKFYHSKCLTGEQLVSYGLCWYCPSCLCRACLIDRDDDNIVLCDGCDHAYHIYCMNPPLDFVPKGKWFCANCKSGMACIWEGKTYGIMRRKRGLDGRLKGRETLYKPGGVDMLLHAAKTLKYEENFR